MPSSPVKQPSQVHAAHVREEVQAFSVPDPNSLTLAEFWKELRYRPQDFEDYHLSDHWDPKDNFGDYMNEISKKILESLPGA